MTKSEKDEVFSRASREDVRFALVDQHADFLYWIVGRIKSDNYNTLKMATFLKDKWETVALRMNSNRELSHQDYAELMTVILHLMDGEFRALGYSRNEFIEICSELQ